MTFNDMLNTDALNSFSEFKESITYTPAGGSAKTINALVVRERRDADPQSRGRIAVGEAEIYVENDATTGVTSVDDSGSSVDKVAFALQQGGSAVTWRVAAVIDKDNGFWHLRVKK